jgi:hypothetical protein
MKNMEDFCVSHNYTQRVLLLLFTIQLTFLPHFPDLFTIQLTFLLYFPNLFTIQLTFLHFLLTHLHRKDMQIRKKPKLNSEKICKYGRNPS